MPHTTCFYSKQRIVKQLPGHTSRDPFHPRPEGAGRAAWQNRGQTLLHPTQSLTRRGRGGKNQQHCPFPQNTTSLQSLPLIPSVPSPAWTKPKPKSKGVRFSISSRSRARGTEKGQPTEISSAHCPQSYRILKTAFHNSESFDAVYSVPSISIWQGLEMSMPHGVTYSGWSVCS